jgi:hypothetical protein
MDVRSARTTDQTCSHFDLQGQQVRKSHLAGKVPEPDQFALFWKLIWNENITHIILLDNCYDGDEVIAHIAGSNSSHSSFTDICWELLARKRRRLAAPQSRPQLRLVRHLRRLRVSKVHSYVQEDIATCGSFSILNVQFDTFVSDRFVSILFVVEHFYYSFFATFDALFPNDV